MRKMGVPTDPGAQGQWSARNETASRVENRSSVGVTGTFSQCRARIVRGGAPVLGFWEVFKGGPQ